jgi:hypothetical protein
MFRAKPAGPASVIDSGARSGRGRWRGGVSRGSTVAAGWLVRLVRLIVVIVVLVIVAGIALALLKANATNTIVSDVHDAARWLVGPFDNVFSFHNARVSLAVNWGIAAIVYLIVGGLVARLLSSRR